MAMQLLYTVICIYIGYISTSPLYNTYKQWGNQDATSGDTGAALPKLVTVKQYIYGGTFDNSRYDAIGRYAPVIYKTDYYTDLYAVIPSGAVNTGLFWYFSVGLA
jgi:hypothetical protein